MYQHQKQFSGNLHALRGLAALSVIFYHTHLMNPPIPVGSLTLMNSLGMGVTLFFILSGFSLSLSNFDKMDSKDWMRSYVIKRIARIVPIWYTFVLITIVYHYFAYNVVFGESIILNNLTFTFPFIPGRNESIVWAGWTVGVEMMFYAVFPIFLLTLRDNIKGWLLVSIVTLAISVSMRPFIGTLFDNSYVGLGFPRRAFIFFWGCTFYFITRKAVKEGWETKWGWAMGAVALCTLTIMTLSKEGIINIHYYWTVPLRALLMGTLTVFFYIAPKIGKREIFNLYNRFTKFLGDKSYTIYLTHPVVINHTRHYYKPLKEAVPNTELAYLIYTLLTILVVFVIATILSTVIEEPLYKRGRALAAKGLVKTKA